MSRTIVISKEYATREQRKTTRSIYTGGYSHITDGGTSSEMVLGTINKILSPEIDVFSCLPTKVFEIEHAKTFLNEMKKTILLRDMEELSGITLPKLRVTEFTDVTLVIEWIFNYFRLYFSFDKIEGDFYGEVINDLENGRFQNEFVKMELEDFSKVAEEKVSYAIMMAEGGV